MSSPRPALRNLTLPELERLVTDELGQPRYRAEQIFRWLHGRRISDPGAMTTLPAALRTQVAASYDLEPLLTVEEALQGEDGTRKLRLACRDGLSIESVLIPREDKLTLCISSQVGCPLGCTFCATALMGLRRNLTAAEIVEQVYLSQELISTESDWVGHERITNLVLMGMGEPLANLDQVLAATEILRSPHGADFSPRRITLSTAGLVPGIQALGQRAPELGLAISLHATTDAVRDQLMPINRRYPLDVLLGALRAYPLPRRRRVTFEYVLLAGINDTPGDAERLPRLLQGIASKVNLLAYNPSRVDQPQLQRPAEATIDAFADRLRGAGLNTTVRRSRGLDIAAACGQLVVTLPDRQRATA